MKDLTGKTIKSYRIQESIGFGGFGIVYRAIQEPIGRPVAVKVIMEERANHPDFIRRFEIEAQLVAKLEHPHTVPLYDYWRDPSGAYLVMRYLSGGNIRELIEESGAIPPKDIARYLGQIASALTFAHQSGVIHRDIKSDNILLDENKNSYLGDFGIAKYLEVESDLTKDNLIGTPAYLSPEQIKNEPLSSQSDIYSLGVLLFEMVTGLRPFENESTASILYKHIAEPIPLVQEFNPNVPPELDLVIQRATTKEPELRYQNAVEMATEFVEIVRSFDSNIQITTHTLTGVGATDLDQVDLQNPYKGLRAFQQSDSDDFYGRSDLIKRLLKRLEASGDSGNFLAIVGPSGSGKSSVIRAGLIPALRRGEIANSKNWFYIELVPGQNPFEELEAALLRIAINPPESLINQLMENERGVLRAIKRVLPEQNSTLFLLIDQFEELFTQVTDDDVRRLFLDNIINACLDSNNQVKIVVTLRADFYDQPLQYVEFGELMRSRTESILPLNRKEIEEAIVEPSRRIGVGLESGLTNAIVRDVYQQSGALPLLQYALTELFERREGRFLTLKAYQDIGGTLGALAKRAETVYEEFTGDKNAIKQMFLRLVTLGEGTEDTRRRVFMEELLSIGDKPKDMQNVIETFTRYRLLTLDHDPQTRAATVEVAHEALLRQWERLRDWLNEDRESLRLHRQLITSANEWEKSTQDNSYLLTGTRLGMFQEWTETSQIALNERESHYLLSSIQRQKELEKQEQERLQREAELERRSRFRIRLLAIVMTFAALISAGLLVIAIDQQRKAEDALKIARENESQNKALVLASNARNTLFENNPVLAVALAQEAVETHNPVNLEVLRVVADTAYAPGARYRWEGHEKSVSSVATSFEKQRSVSTSSDGSIVIWDNENGEILHKIQLADAILYHVDINDQGTAFVVASSDQQVYVYDLETAELLHTLKGHTGQVIKADFSSSGKYIASGGYDRVLRLWDAQSGELIREFPEQAGVILSLKISPDESFIVTGAGDETPFGTSEDKIDRLLRIYDLEAGTLIKSIIPASGYIRTVDISHDNQKIATGTWDSQSGGTIRIWDVKSGEELDRFFAHTTSITAVEFNPDSSMIASGAWDNTLQIWEIERGIPVEVFTGFTNRILDIAYSQDGHYILTSHGDIGDDEYNPKVDNPDEPVIWYWDLVNRAKILELEGHGDWIWAVDVSDDGLYIASGGGPLRKPTAVEGKPAPTMDTLIHLWDGNTGELLKTLDGHSFTVDSIEFLPDNQHLLSAGWDGQILLWDMDKDTPLKSLQTGADIIYDLVVMDDKQFLSADSNGLISLWDLESSEIIRQYIGHEGAVNGIALSPDQQILASAGNDGLVMLWDIETAEPIRQLKGHTSGVNEVAFTPDGKYLASSSWDDSIRIWDVEKGSLYQLIKGHNGNTFGLAFDKSGDILLSTSQDETVRMWNIHTGEEYYRFNGHTDWIQEIKYFPDMMRAVSVGQDNRLIIWRILSSAQEILDWAANNRYQYDLSCSERDRYRLPACSDSELNQETEAD